MKASSLIILASFLVSCGTKNNTNENKNAFTKNESSGIPKIDSLFLDELSEHSEFEYQLTGEKVQTLFANYKPLNVKGHFYNVIPEFLKIDSLKRNGLYHDYLIKMDIGFLQNAEAYLLKKMALNTDQKAELWFIKYSSYEACPYFHGVDVFLSFYTQNILQRTIQVGSNYAVADPPMAFESILGCEQKDNQIHIYLKQKELDMDTDKIIEENNQTFTFNLTNGTFQE